MSVKVKYFNGRGLAEPIRILLKIGNVNFEDVRFEREDWPAIKPTTPFGQVPVYEEDGKVMCQSLAIIRYLAKKVNLVGATDWENLEIDAIGDTVNDFRQKAAPIYMESDPEKKEALKTTFLGETVPYYLERVAKLAAQNGGYLAVNKLTWVDIFFVTALDLINLLVGRGDILEKYPDLLAVRKHVNEHPAISAWIESRPKTEF